jgi:hypothetical protein
MPIRLVPTPDIIILALLVFATPIAFLLVIFLLALLVGPSRFPERTKSNIFGCAALLSAIGFSASLAWLFWPRFTPAVSPPERIDNMQELARLVFSQYDTGEPICIVPLLNPVDTYLLLLSGTELKALFQATNVTVDILAALSVFDFYIHRAKEAVGEFRMPNGNQIDSADFILAGHSLGGMEAENLAADREFASRYHIIRLITFGKPKTRAHLSNDAIARHFLLTDDPVVRWVDRLIFFVPAHSPGTVWLPPPRISLENEHSNYPVSEALKGYDGMGDPIQNGDSGTALITDPSHSGCFGADNPKMLCTPNVHTFGCNPL